MTNKPKRRRTRNTPAPAPVYTESGFWGTIATYASELAPVAGPLLDAIGQTAMAIDRAERRNRSLEAGLRLLESQCEDNNEGGHDSQAKAIYRDLSYQRAKT